MTNRESQLSHDGLQHTLAIMAAERQVSVWAWRHTDSKLKDFVEDQVRWIIQDHLQTVLYIAAISGRIR